MKIRKDFVTNSSSSNFIIIYKPTAINEDNLYIVGLEKLLNYIVNDGKKIHTLDELDKHFINSYKYYDYSSLEELLKEKSYIKEEYDNYKQKIINGFIISIISVEDDQEKYISLLSSIENNENFYV